MVPPIKGILRLCVYQFDQYGRQNNMYILLSIKDITTLASREITSRKIIKIFDFNEVNAAKHWHVFSCPDILVTLGSMCSRNQARMSRTNTRVYMVYISLICPHIIDIRRHSYKMLYVSPISAIYTTHWERIPRIHTLYSEPIAHAMTLCGVHVKMHVYTYCGPHVCYHLIPPPPHSPSKT